MDLMSIVTLGHCNKAKNKGSRVGNSFQAVIFELRPKKKNISVKAKKITAIKNDQVTYND